MTFSAGHLLIIAVILLLIGGHRLPEVGTKLGKVARHFKKKP